MAGVNEVKCGDCIVISVLPVLANKLTCSVRSASLPSFCPLRRVGFRGEGKLFNRGLFLGVVGPRKLVAHLVT